MQISTTLAIQNYLVIEDVLNDFENWSDPYVFTTAKAYFRHIYFEACDLLHGELEERFSDKHIPSVIAIEKPSKCSKWS